MKKKSKCRETNTLDLDAIRGAIRQLQGVVERLQAAIGEQSGASLGTVSPTRDVMKAREYADRLRVNVRKVHGWVRDGMPHFQVEGRLRIRVADADAWLAEQADKHKHAQVEEE